MNINLTISSLTSILKDISAIGGIALLVGGCIRDSLLGNDSKDIDPSPFLAYFD